MKKIAQELKNIVDEYTLKLLAISEHEFEIKINPVKWSKKEVLGHLIDSAQNNLRRFISGQYENQPHILYEQNFWVSSNNYQQVRKEDIIELWRLMNNQICQVLISMEKENYSKQCNTSRTQEPDLHSIEWLATDYLKHLKHHVNQIIEGSFDVVYR